MKKGQIAEGRIDYVVFPNKGIAITEEGDRVVVKNTIPGQNVSFLVNKLRKGKAEGRLLETIEKSSLEVEPSCPHFGECGGCTYLSLPYEKQLEYIINAGCDGVKFLNMKPNMRKTYGKGLNHPDYDKLFAAMEEIGIPCLIHSKDPIEFWHKELMLPEHIEYGWCYDGEGFLTYEEHHKETLERLDKNPNLKVILAHVFFLDTMLPEAIRVMEKYPNVCFDLAPHTGMFESFSKDVEGWREFFIKYQDRIMFGSDADDRRDQKTIDEIYNVVETSLTAEDKEMTLECYENEWNIRGLHLPKEVTEKIFCTNFSKFMGGKRNEVNNELLIKMAEHAYNKLQTIPDHKDTPLFKYFLDSNK